MPKVINLSGVVGWDLTAKELTEQLDGLNGESVRFDINSPGGSVFDGLEIYNLIKNYEGETETRLISLGASMGSIISLAGDKRTAEDTAVYMIHNASGVSWGDYRDLQKTADLLKNISGHLANIYASKTGLEKSEITDMMDNETWLFGAELEKFGFQMIETDSEKDKETATAVAKLDFENCIEKMKNYKEPTEKIAAMFKEKTEGNITMEKELAQIEKLKAEMELKKLKLESLNAVSPPVTAQGKNKIQEAKKVDKKTLIAGSPELYAEIMAEGQEKERKRVEALNKWGKINSNCNDLAEKAKAEGKSVEDIMPDLLAVAQMPKEAVEAQVENAPDISAVSKENQSEEDKVSELLAMSEVV